MFRKYFFLQFLNFYTLNPSKPSSKSSPTLLPLKNYIGQPWSAVVELPARISAWISVRLRMSMSNYPYHTDIRSDIRISKSGSDIRADIHADIRTDIRSHIRTSQSNAASARTSAQISVMYG